MRPLIFLVCFLLMGQGAPYSFWHERQLDVNEARLVAAHKKFVPEWVEYVHAKTAFVDQLEINVKFLSTTGSLDINLREKIRRLQKATESLKKHAKRVSDEAGKLNKHAQKINPPF